MCSFSTVFSLLAATRVSQGYSIFHILVDFTNDFSSPVWPGNPVQYRLNLVRIIVERYSIMIPYYCIQNSIPGRYMCQVSSREMLASERALRLTWRAWRGALPKNVVCDGVGQLSDPLKGHVI